MLLNPKAEIKIKTLYARIDNNKNPILRKTYSLTKIKPRNIRNKINHLSNQPISNAYISSILYEKEKEKENDFLRHSNCCLDFHPKWQYSYYLSKNNVSSSVNNFYTKIKELIKKPRILISTPTKPRIIQILENNGQMYQKIYLNPWKYKPVFWKNNLGVLNKSRNLNISINKNSESQKEKSNEMPSVKITKIEFQHNNFHSDDNSKNRNKSKNKKEISKDKIKKYFLSPQNNLKTHKGIFKISEKETESNDMIDKDKYDMTKYIMGANNKKLKNVEIDNDNKTSNNSNIYVCQNDSKYETIKIKKNKMMRDVGENTIF